MTIADRDLHAFVDGELPEARRREVAQWLAERPEVAVRVAAWRSQNEAIRRLFPPASAFRPQPAVRTLPPAEDAIRDSDFRTPARRQRQRSANATAMVMIAAAFAIGAAIVLAREIATAPRLEPAPAVAVATVEPAGVAQRAIAAWRAYANDPTHAVEIAAGDPSLGEWLMKRTGLARTPEMAGARLVGARVTPGADRPAAFLLYETGDRARIALVVEPALGAPPTSASGGEIAARAWRADGFDHALAGPISRARLDSLAETLGR